MRVTFKILRLVQLTKRSYNLLSAFDPNCADLLLWLQRFNQSASPFLSFSKYIFITVEILKNFAV